MKDEKTLKGVIAVYKEKEAIQRMFQKADKLHEKTITYHPSRRLNSDERGLILDRNNPDDKEWFDDDSIE